MHGWCLSDIEPNVYDWCVYIYIGYIYIYIYIYHNSLAGCFSQKIGEEHTMAYGCNNMVFWYILRFEGQSKFIGPLTCCYYERNMYPQTKR